MSCHQNKKKLKAAGAQGDAEWGKKGDEEGKELGVFCGRGFWHILRSLQWRIYGWALNWMDIC